MTRLAVATCALAAGLVLAGSAALERVRPVAAPARPTRIVALTLASAEMLLDLVPRERIAAVHQLAAHSTYSNVRDALDGIALVGWEAEEVIAVEPDLVLSASYVERELAEPIARAGLAVHTFTDFEDLEAVLRNYRTLGDLVGEPERARARIAALRAEIAAIRASIPAGRAAPRVVWLDAAGMVAGARTPFDALCRLAGARNLAAEHGVVGLQAVDAEALAHWRPDVIVIGVDPGSGASLRGRLRRDPVYAPLAGARVVEIPYPRIACVSQYLVDGLRDLVRGLYA